MNHVSSIRLNYYDRAITQDFGDALHDLGGIIAQTDDGVRAKLQRVLLAKLERVLSRFLTQIRQDADIAADQSLQAGANRSKNRSRTNNNPANDSESFHDPITVDGKRGGGHGCIHEANLVGKLEIRNSKQI